MGYVKKVVVLGGTYHKLGGEGGWVEGLTTTTKKKTTKNEISQGVAFFFERIALKKFLSASNDLNLGVAQWKSFDIQIVLIIHH